MHSKRAFILAGASGSGKTSLIAALNGWSVAVRKTQSLVFHANYIDLPGEFLTHPALRRQFLGSINQARAILFLLAANAVPSPIPSRFISEAGWMPCLGIVSQIDRPEAKIDYAERELSRLGVRPPYYHVSLYDPASIEALGAVISAFIADSNAV